MRALTSAPAFRDASASVPGRARRALGLLLLAVFAVFAFGCSTVPYSQRNRVILLSEGEEMQMGVDAYRQILAEAKPLQNSQWNAIVERCGRRIAAVADKSLQEHEREPFDWEFAVIDEDTVNAFALPGGKVAFYKGILSICQDEAGVAVVMGHEVAHALARHGGERVSQQLVLNLGISVAAAMSSSNPETQETVAGLLGAGAGIAFALPFSRSHESEADYIGLIMMAEAGYDPRVAPGFWERMAALKEQSGADVPPEFLSTHPSDETRIQALNNAMSEALDYYEAATGKRVERRTEILTSE